MKKNGIVAAAVLGVMAAALFSSLVFYTSNRTADDAFISLRYAHNLADGHGFRFNPGGETIEGFSSPLHVLILAAAAALGTDPWPTVQLVGIAGFLAATGLLAWWGVRHLGPFWGTAAAVAFAFNPGAGYWSRGGLETTIFTALAVLALVLNARRRWLAMGVAAGLLAVTRPDGFLFALPLFAGAALETRRTGRPWSDLGRPLLSFALFPVSWLVFRLAYFGAVFPNTYYAKMDGVRSAQVERGAEYLASYLQRSEILVPLVIFVTGLCLHLALRRDRRLPATWVLTGAGMIAASFFFSLVSGGDHMANHRFLVPATPLILAGAAWAASHLARIPSRRRWVWGATVLLAFAYLSQPLRILSHDLRHPTYPLDRPVGLVEPLDDSAEADRFRLGVILKGILPSDTVLAIVPAGVVPFLTGFETIDMLGLNDREIGRQTVPDMGSGRMGHEKGSGRIVLGRKPDVILMRNFRNPPGEAPAPPQESDFGYRPVREIWNDPEFHRRYEAFVVPIGEGKSFTLHRRI